MFILIFECRWFSRVASQPEKRFIKKISALTRYRMTRGDAMILTFHVSTVTSG